MRFFLLSILCMSLVAGAAAQAPSVRQGPMVGYGEMTETMLWVQTTAKSTVQYRYWVEGEKSHALLSKKSIAQEENDFITKIVLTDLKPGSRYEYELLLDGKLSVRPHPLTFVTQTIWQWRSDPPSFSVAFGSCAFVNEPFADRPGKPYAGSYNIFTSITEKRPDVMLWLGDNYYFREVDYHALSRMRYRVARDRALPEMQQLLGSTHNYAIWDDHDFGDDNSDRTYRLRTESLELFKQVWANQTYGTLETPGVFFKFSWSDADFFMTDNRFHRSPQKMPDDGKKSMFGDAQMQWLKECLIASKATFKIVVSGGQVLAWNKVESLRHYPAEYDELIGWIKSQNISGVVFLSGDRHLADLSCLPDSLFYPLYDFTSSPLTAGLASNAKPDENPLSVPGTFVNDARNFGMLKFDGPRENRRLTMELYDDSGKLRWAHVVLASELKSSK